MQKVNWKPDTCECHLTLDIDGENVSCSAVVSVCEYHNGVTPQEIFAKAHGDNVYKNTCIKQICEDHAVEAKDVEFTYDAERKLALTCITLSKTQIESATIKVPPVTESTK